MNTYRKQRQRIWLRAYKAELKRRKALFQKDPVSYKEIVGPNLKPLTDCCVGEHVWVPATILWVHDKDSTKFTFGGVARRSLEEASIYRSDGVKFLPQICWNCCTGVREKTLIRSNKLSLAAQIQVDNQRKKKRSHKEVKNLVTLDSLEDLNI